MKIRKPLVILGVLIAVLSAYLLLKQNDRSLYELPAFVPIEAMDITRIEIKTPDQQIPLYLKDSGWVVGQDKFAADEKRLQQMLDTIANLTITTLIAESKNYQRYGLDNENRIAITAWSGDQRLRNFEVGENASSSRHTFVRLAEDHRVFHARGDVRQPFEVTLDDVRDKTVLNFDGNQIHTIRIQKENQTVAFVKATGSGLTGQDSTASTEGAAAPTVTWKTDQGKSVQSRILDKLVEQLAQLTCKQFVYDHSRADFKNPLFTLTLEGTEVYTLAIFNRLEKGGALYPAISSHSDYPFLLPRWQVNQIMLNPDDISASDEIHQRQG